MYICDVISLVRKKYIINRKDKEGRMISEIIQMYPHNEKVCVSKVKSGTSITDKIDAGIQSDFSLLKIMSIARRQLRNLFQILRKILSFIYIYNFICLFLAVLGLHCCTGSFLVVTRRVLL